jgi:hypothetical protein
VVSFTPLPLYPQGKSPGKEIKKTNKQTYNLHDGFKVSLADCFFLAI